jgi:hypothetical protein
LRHFKLIAQIDTPLLASAKEQREYISAIKCGIHRIFLLDIVTLTFSTRVYGAYKDFTGG